jgi:hypothetical protein
MTNLQKEYIAEIRNAYMSMCGILRRVAKKNLTDSQGWIEIGIQLRRQRDYFEMLGKEDEKNEY